MVLRGMLHVSVRQRIALYICILFGAANEVSFYVIITILYQVYVLVFCIFITYVVHVCIVKRITLHQDQ